jgi:hypothetical protein
MAKAKMRTERTKKNYFPAAISTSNFSPQSKRCTSIEPMTTQIPTFCDGSHRNQRSGPRESARRANED